MIERFEDLEVWQLAREISNGVYRAGRTQELRRDYALLNQMKRAATSVAGNIAEGFERGTRKQHIEYCYIAKGSAGELRSHVIIAHDVELLNDEAFRWLHEKCESCSRMLSACISSLERTADQFRGIKYKPATAPSPASPSPGDDRG